MRPRPLYKWKSFWLGILVLGFMGWAWARSTARMDGVSWGYNDKGDNMELWHAFGGIDFSMGNDPFDTGTVPGIGGYSYNLAVSPVPTGRLPIWFLMLHFCLVWSAWLFFHWKREQRKFSASAFS